MTTPSDLPQPEAERNWLPVAPIAIGAGLFTVSILVLLLTTRRHNNDGAEHLKG